VRHALGAVHPLLDLAAFKVPSFAVTVSGGRAVPHRHQPPCVSFAVDVPAAFGAQPARTRLLLLARVCLAISAMKPATTTVLRPVRLSPP